METTPYAPDTGPAEGSPYGPYAAGQTPPDATQTLAAAQAARGADMATSSAMATPQLQASQVPTETFEPPEQKLQRESWGNRVYHSVLSAMGGQYDTQFIPTENGVVKQQVATTPGQQWKRIISAAMIGAGGAAAAGTQGPGGIMRGLGGGIQAGYGERIREGEQNERTANTQFQQEQEAAMNTARKSLVASQIAKSAWDLSYSKKQAYEADLTNEAMLEKMYQDAKADGAIDLGVMPTFQDAAEKFRNDPTLHASHAEGQIVPIAHVNAKGELDGLHAIWVPKAWQQRKATDDFTYQYLTGYDDKGKPQFQPMTIGKSTNATNGEVQDAKLANADRLMNFHKQEVETETKQRQMELEEQAAPGKRALTWAQAEDARASAKEKGFGTDSEAEGVVDLVGTGRATVDRLAGLLAKPSGQAFLARVVAKYPDFSPNKVKGYVEAVQDFTSTKLGSAGGNLRTVGGALAQLEKLKDLNHKFGSSTYGTEANSSYKTQVHNVAPEIAKFLGTSTKEGIENIENELLSTTTGNRDAAILTQTQALGDVIDQYDQSWRNAAPSTMYEAPMPGLSQEVKDARARLDPVYAKRSGGGVQAPGAPAPGRLMSGVTPPPGGVAPPPPPTGGAAQPGMVKVQIPGQLPGQVSAQNLEQFKKDHPTAQVIQ